MKNMVKKMLCLLLTLTMAAGFAVPVLAVEDASSEIEDASPAVSEVLKEADIVVSLADAQSFTASVTLPEGAEVSDPEAVEWTLTRNADAGYLDADMFPNQTEGGALDSFFTSSGEALFVVDGVEADGDAVNLSFSSVCYWGDDPSAPHMSGGQYLDVCGCFDLTAALDGETLGSVSVKITPYDSFHTMQEIYDDLDAMVDFAADLDIYFEKFSMGSSSGDIYEPLDMPYLILAADEDAVDEWLAFSELAETDPTAVLAGIENGDYDDIAVPVMYSNVHANEVAAADGVMAFTWMLLEAAAGDGELSYTNLTGFTEAGEEELSAEFETLALAVPELIEDKASYLGFITEGNTIFDPWYGSDKAFSGPVDLEKYYTTEQVDVKLDELLWMIW